MCVQGVLQDFRLLWIQQALLLDKLLVFYLEKYDANNSIPAKEPTKISWPCSNTTLQCYVFFLQCVADDARLCILFFVNSREHLKIKKPQVY